MPVDYPLPIDAAGRTALILLTLGLFRVHGAALLSRAGASRPRRAGWLDTVARLGLRRSVRRWTVRAAPPCFSLLVIAAASAWSAYAALALAGDFADGPFEAALGCSLAGLAAWRARPGDPGERLK